MAISKIKGSAIQDATIPEDKLEDEAGSFRMILDGTDGSATNTGDFVLLDATASSTNVGEQFLFEPATDDGSAVLSGGDLKFDNVEILMDKKSLMKSEGGAVTTNIGQGILKAWVVDASSEAATVGDSLNKSSFSDDNTGRTTITLVNPMSTAKDYCVSYACVSGYPYRGRADTASTYKLETVNDGGNYADGVANGMVAGDLA